MLAKASYILISLYTQLHMVLSKLSISQLSRFPLRTGASHAAGDGNRRSLE